MESFLAYMESEDAEMGGILRAHVDFLLPATDDAERRGTRTLFNLSVTPRLDEPLRKALVKIEVEGKALEEIDFEAVNARIRTEEQGEKRMALAFRLPFLHRSSTRWMHLRSVSATPTPHPA